MKKKTPSIIKLATIAMLTAVSFVLFLWEVPILPSLGYLKLDFSDIPALIGALYIGPFAGVVIEFFKNLIQLMVKGIGDTMGYGNIMNFLVGTAYIFPFALVFNKLKKSKNKTFSAIFASLTGLVSIVVIGFVGNYFIAPFFFKNFMNVILTAEALKGAVVGATIINVIKGVMLSVVSFPIIFAVLDRIKKSEKN